MEKNNIEIRSIEKKDNEGIYRLIRSILESYNLDKPGTAYFDPHLNKLYEFYQQSFNGKYWVLIKDEKVYGGIGVASFGEYTDIAEIQKFYVSRDLQGQGLGRALYEKAEEHAKKKGFKKLYIETTEVLGKANHIYEHFGYSQIEEPLAGSDHSSMDKWFIKEI